MAFDYADWKRRLADVLKEHPDIGVRATGMIEINVNEGGITRVYLNKKVKNASEAAAAIDQWKDKVESSTVRINIG